MKLVHVNDGQQGIRRIRRGRGFSYHYADGRLITDRQEIQRIKAIAIPPAYTEVWICANPCGHLQATGRDARGQKQYLYHPRWRVRRSSDKFDRIVAFGEILPALRRRVGRDLALDGLPHDKVAALLVRLLDDTLIRVGSDRYARDNSSYGLTTLRNRHVRKYRGRLRFTFRGKSGQGGDVELDDRRLIGIIRRLQRLPGQRLFQYIDEEGGVQPVDSGMINQYLQTALSNGRSQEFSAKDFRTWGGTVNAARVLACTPLPRKNRRRGALAEAIDKVAAILGNTAVVCRASYIHPRVLEGWEDGSLQRAVTCVTAGYQRKLEKRLLRFLE